MPTLTRWYVKASLVYLAIALLAGAVLAARSLVRLPEIVSGLGPVYWHLLMVGWITQLIFGIGHWMFPKYSPEKPRGSERLGWWTFALLNVGLVFRAIGEPWVALQPGSAAGYLVAASAVLQWLAGWAFVVNSWPRIKEK